MMNDSKTHEEWPPLLYGYFFKTSEEARKILNEMKRFIKERGSITIFDFRNLIDLPTNFPYYKMYGWNNLDKAFVAESKFGYGLYLPYAQVINKEPNF